MASENTTEEDIQEQELILAALCTDAPTDEIRNCLRKYCPKKREWQLLTAFKQVKKPILVETLEYLGLAGMDQYKAEALPHELVCRIQNLFPDVCHICKNKYCVKLIDKPIISCVRCGQGCHNRCVLQLIGKTEDDLGEDNNLGDLVNPHASLGLYYLCSYCVVDVIPKKEELKVKSKAKKKDLEVIDNQNQSTANTTEASGIETGEAQAGGQASTSQAQFLPRDSSGDVEVSPNETSSQQNTQINHSRLARLPHQVREPVHSRNIQTENTPICRYYSQGRCKYGISGRKDGQCPYKHPKPCQKFITNGDRRQRGCTRGSQCRSFHPKMCQLSLRERICSREDCKYMHIRGTRRSEPTQPQQDQGQRQQGEGVRRNNSSRPENQPVSVRKTLYTENSQNQGSFLELKELKDQMALIHKKLEQTDLNFNLVLQQLPMLAFQPARVNIGQQGLVQQSFQPQIMQRPGPSLQTTY